MASSAVFRLESLLEARKLDRTLAREPESQAPRLATGIAGLDAALDGGWRQGEVSEVVGPRSSGRTRVLVAAMASATAQGGIVGLVDAVDRFDPAGAAQAGVGLDRVLWVRGPQIAVEQARATLIDRAVHQALRAFDLLIRAGGFTLVVFDVADIPPRYLRGLPHTTWMRLAHANAGQSTVCLLVGDAAMGRSARGATAELAATARWTGASPQSRRLAGLDIQARVRDARHARVVGPFGES
jgi:RecA/RadA recombinase